MARPREFDADEVLDAAMDTFWRQGYAATSTQDLVDSTGIGRGSLYNAFTSKHTMFVAALHHYRQRAVRTQIAPLEEEGPVLHRIRRLMMDVIDRDLVDPDRRGCLAMNTAIELAGKDEEATQAVREGFGQLETALITIIDQGQRTGEIHTNRSAPALARFVMSTYYGLRVLAKTATDPRPLIDIVDATLDALC